MPICGLRDAAPASEPRLVPYYGADLREQKKPETTNRDAGGLVRTAN